MAGNKGLVAGISIGFHLFVSVAIAQSDANGRPESFTKPEEEVAKKLAEAKAEFKSQVELASSKILGKFDDEEAQARKKEKFETVEKLLRERQDFKDRGIVPKRFPADSFNTAVKKAKARMLETYNSCRSKYLNLKADDAVKALGREIEVFQKNPWAVKGLLGDGMGRNNVRNMESLQGNWVITSSVKDGKVLPMVIPEKWVFTFVGNQYTLRQNGAFAHSGTWQIDARVYPSHLDQLTTEGKDKGNVKFGIIAWDGPDVLICISTMAGRRPSSFEAKAGEGSQYCRLSRLKQ